MKIESRRCLSALAALLLIAGCAGNRERDDDTQARSARMLQEEDARREGYRQGYSDATGRSATPGPQNRLRSRFPELPGDGFGAAPPAPIPSLPGGL